MSSEVKRLTGSTDRRVRRTKSLLHQALIELMLERGYDRISVRDILHRADVGRSTFYAHFRDKDDLLLLSSTDYLRAAVTAPGTDTDVTTPLAPVHTLFQLAAANPEVYQALVGRKSGALLLRTTREMVAEILAERLAELLDMDEAEFDSTVTFLSWGVVGVLGAIADADPPVAPTEAYQRLEQLIGPGLSGRVRSG
ncbi:TetR/AcrR family transcriptional regulator [Nocardia sp. NBC_01499]|uniref:TetR/AcrR family transcriptional regulator n=1 Tax=Nocardia sp. NBC_01499 TaxID=2903597 RepID=UPI003869A1BB